MAWPIFFGAVGATAAVAGLGMAAKAGKESRIAIDAKQKADELQEKRLKREQLEDNLDNLTNSKAEAMANINDLFGQADVQYRQQLESDFRNKKDFAFQTLNRAKQHWITYASKNKDWILEGANRLYDLQHSRSSTIRLQHNIQKEKLDERKEETEKRWEPRIEAAKTELESHS